MSTLFRLYRYYAVVCIIIMMTCGCVWTVRCLTWNARSIFQQRCARWKKPFPQRQGVAIKSWRENWSRRTLVRNASTSNNDPSSTNQQQQQQQQQRTLVRGLHISEMEVKKSRFVAYASHATSWDDAKQQIQHIKCICHPKARHVCFGFKSATRNQERSSDDGEPVGTAGAPIVHAIQSEQLQDVLCVVVRYFGGIKLGAGGLIRAYGGAARQVLRAAPVQILIPQSSIRVQVQTAYMGVTYDVVAKVYGKASDEEYGTDGAFTVTLTCPSDRLDQLQARLMDATKGDCVFL